jgi:hypothetical protein
VGLFLVKSPVGGVFTGYTYRETAIAMGYRIDAICDGFVQEIKL